MIAPRMTPHVGGLRHVTSHALTSTVALIVVRVHQRFDQWGIQEARRVATLAERVALENQFISMGVVAVAAAHPRLVHTAAEKRSVHVVLIPDLSIRIVAIGCVHDSEQKVIFE